jgi:predicted MFS family arabinose efflux permease
LLQTLLPSELSKYSSKQHVGLVMGLCDSIKSFSGVLAPTFSGFIFEAYGMTAPSYASAVLTALALLIYCVAPADAPAEALAAKKSN